MKLIVNERDGCCESVNIECTPTEALIINQAMRRYVCDDEVNEKDRNIMKHMLEVKPIYVDIAESEDDELLIPASVLDKIREEIKEFAEETIETSSDSDVYASIRYCLVIIDMSFGL